MVGKEEMSRKAIIQAYCLTISWFNFLLSRLNNSLFFWEFKSILEEYPSLEKEGSMVETKHNDTAESEARKKAIEKAGLPKELRRSYRFYIDCGSLILRKRVSRRLGRV